jgi:hypothetical protein
MAQHFPEFAGPQTRPTGLWGEQRSSMRASGRAAQAPDAKVDAIAPVHLDQRFSIRRRPGVVTEEKNGK